MAKFMTIGEPLIVFASKNKDQSLEESQDFKKYLAGAELNVAVGIARLGHQGYYISDVGQDFMGKFIIKQIKEQNINAKYIGINPNFSTGFYFKQSVSKGDPKIEYFRKNSPASNYDYHKLKDMDLTDVKIIHLSGIMAAISQNGFKTVEKMFEIANEKGILTTFDPNIRIELWENEKIMGEKLNYLASKASIVMPGITEAKMLTKLNEPNKIADFYFNQSKITNMVIIKNGADGIFLKKKNEKLQKYPSYKVEHIVDTVGAGDGFAVGIITGILENLSLDDTIKRACAIGAIAVQSPGDNDGYPNKKQLEEYIENNEYIF